MSVYRIKTKSGCLVSAQINQPVTMVWGISDWHTTERIPVKDFVEYGDDLSKSIRIIPIWKKVIGKDINYLVTVRNELKEFEDGYMGNRENKFFKKLTRNLSRLNAVLPDMLHIGADVGTRSKRSQVFQKFVKPEHEVDIKWTHVL